MALEDLLATLREETERECRLTVSEARREARRIGDESEGERRDHLEKEGRNERRVWRSAGEKLVCEASLETEGERSKLLEEYLSRATQDAAEGLRDLRANPKYPAILSALAKEALTGLDDALLQVDPRDLELAKRLLKGLAGIEAGPPTAGGVRAVASKRRVLIDNTVESRLERARVALLPDLIRILEQG